MKGCALAHPFYIGTIFYYFQYSFCLLFMNLQQYKKRIHFNGDLVPDIDVLSQLQRKHVLAIPFEDIDIQNRHPISLKYSDIYSKIIDRKRGGYCYELNGLFYKLLKTIGFDVSMISGRVVSGNRVGPEFDHLALMVKLNGKSYLVDVGFGDFSLQPLVIETGAVQFDGYNKYTINIHTNADGTPSYVVSKWNHASARYDKCYVFSDTPREYKEFFKMHDYQQSSSESHFVKNYICTRALQNGRLSIVNNRITVTYKGRKKSRRIDEKDRAYLLYKYFGIITPGTDALSHTKEATA